MRRSGAACARTWISPQSPAGGWGREETMDSPQEILRRRGLRAKHSWGQNFLGDPDVLGQIAASGPLQAGETGVALAPGLGHLTRALLDTGANVVAVERD